MRTDLLIVGNQVIAATGGLAYVISFQDPTNPLVTATLTGVGSKLALTDDNLLLSVYQTLINGSDPRGMHGTALGMIALIKGVSSMPVEQNGALWRTTADVKVDFGLVPSAEPVAAGSVEILKGTDVLATLPGDCTSTPCSATWPAGQTVDLNAQYFAQAKLETANTGVLTSFQKRIYPFVLDVDVDSDNNNGTADPARSITEEQIEDRQGEVTKPGKVVFVNDGDTDGDHVPDFADGIDLYDQFTDKANGPFVPVIVELPQGVDLNQARVKFLYSASSPRLLQRQGTQQSGYTYTLPSGALRLWRKDGPKGRKSASLSEGGDFVASGEEYTVAQLGTPIKPRTWRFYVEGIDYSRQTAAEEIKVEGIFPQASGPERRTSDGARVTLLQMRLVQADENNNIRPVRDVKFSHPSPVVTVQAAEVTNLRLEENDTKIVGDIVLSGQVRCTVCDFTPGAQGQIDTVKVFLHDSETELATLPVSSTKANEQASLLKPFEYQGVFSATVPNVELSDGANHLRVEATDKVLGISGYAQMGVPVRGTAPEPLELDYRVSVDFAGATSLAQLTTTYPVHVTITDRGGATPRTVETDVFRESDGALVFASAEASVTFGDAMALDAALSVSTLGTVQAAVSVPSFADVVLNYRLKETSASSSVFARDLARLRLELGPVFSSSVPDVLTALVENAQGTTQTAQLTETGNDTQVFASSDATFVVGIPVQQPLGGRAAGVLQAVVTNGGLGIAERSLTVLETAEGSAVFETIEKSTIDTFDRSTYAGWSFVGALAESGPRSTGGEFNPYLLQVLGPDDLLGQMDTVQTADGPRRVRRAFDGNFYVHMKNSPPAVILMLPNAGGAATGTSASVPEASLPFLKGYVKGLLLGGYSIIEGVFQLGALSLQEFLRIQPLGVAYVMTFGDHYESELKFARDAKDLAIKLGEIALQVNQDQQAIIEALLVGDQQVAAAISEPYAVALEFSVELLKELGNEYAASPPEQQGEIFGRAMFEIFTLALAYAKAGQLGKLAKLEFLTQLKNVAFFRQPKPAAAFQRLEGLLVGLQTTRMCFIAGTKVHTKAGLRNIEDIRAGDWVLSRDPMSKRQVYKRVQAALITNPVRLYHVRYRARESHASARSSGAQHGDAADGEGAGEAELVATGEHPFYEIGREAFVEAKALRPGDRLSLAGGATAEVVSVEIEEAEEGRPFTTYNFEVEDFHTYFVGDEGVWVHNVAGRECQQIFSIYQRLRARGKAPDEIMRFLEQRLPKFTQNEKVMGRALEEALKDALPGVPRAWTAGKPGDGAVNAWSHWIDHSRKLPQPDIPAGIADAVTYVRRAREFAAKPRSQHLWGTRIRDGLLEEVRYDPVGGEFAVFKLAGAEQGAIKTYFVPKVGLGRQERLLYFADQGPFIQSVLD
jgi:hypothetical protein